MAPPRFLSNLFRTSQQGLSQEAGDIRDELMFHFRQLVSEKLAQGATFDAAWEQAEKQFGPVRRFETECQAVHVQSRLGWSIAAVALLFLIAAGGAWKIQDSKNASLQDNLKSIQHSLTQTETARSTFEQKMEASLNAADERVTKFQSAIQQANAQLESMQTEQSAIKSEQAAIASKTAQATVELMQPKLADLTGTVLDTNQQPLFDVKMLIILKTWPGGRYQQEDFQVVTDAKGQFVLPKLVPIEGRYAIQIAAMKDGYAFESRYHLKKLPNEKLEPISFQLSPATPKTVVFKDDSGKPLSNVNVIPSTRTSPNGNEFLIYFQGADSIKKTTDAEGRISLATYAVGDAAELYYQLPGQKWVTRKLNITDGDIVVEVISTIGGNS